MTPPADLSAARAADFEESPQLKIKRLERTLADERKFAVKSTRQLHRVLARDLKAAEKKAEEAERRAAAAEKRVETARARAARAEAELEAIRQTTTWKAGRAVVAVPARIKRGLGRP
ncbi:hypothetical protein [Nocardioides sp.]|uniref:hypothetical protein n=1 Tax=Nocardioides sp. TaxID=35761 RepID=UPI0027185879|nr:hypothetical protein [Nocardioides sp.]MDO9455077.1 hypothetical protein [Nocardioides sp.]